ncbi:FAD:protein FMN transferase [Candidatus Protochlamydia amoebophila]|uniref:FAD:protein FMN transferase n=1 Tax=Protochlamydia amoebophila (strain UWE25) TaxID=264201 RepID=Q6MAH3_PARUW|nr:FAD:protein FMN transferase [Candidatus Protochlamydia amoebophila]CAF24426.1 unnamed protein product [Candidatus Protochlamydia amoebophila UWE25]
MNTIHLFTYIRSLQTFTAKFRSLFMLIWMSFSFLLMEGCQTSQSEVVTTFQDVVMTVQYRILVGNSVSEVDKIRIQTIIDSTFEEIDTIYNKWNPQSEISRLNSLKAFQTIPLSPQLFQLFKQIDALVILSEGLFDPTIEPLQKLWKEKLNSQQLPSPDEIALIKPSIGWDKIHFEKGIFFKENSLTELDLGGIAKGFAIDLLISRLNEAGFPNLYVEWGGDIRTSGRHPAKRPWNIYISHLDSTDPKDAIAFLSLNNQAIATSGDYFQYWTVISNNELQTYCHIFNPLTLSPLKIRTGSIASASLVANDCLTADALAKVMMLFDSKEEAEQWVKKMQSQIPSLAYWMLIRASFNPE